VSFLDTDRSLASDSWYAATTERPPPHPPLAGEAHCDVAVVGGGLAGLSAAIELAGRGFAVTLLEAGRLGGGASGRNGGQVIHGLACDQSVIESQLGQVAARQVWDMSIEAIELIHERRRAFAIDCDWRDGYLGLAVSARKARALRAWADRIDTVYGYPMPWIEAAEIDRWIASPRYHSGLHDPRSGHLHPLKYGLGLARAAAARGVRLHEGSRVLSLVQGSPAVLHTAGGRLHARQVLLAGNVYLGSLAPALAPRIMPVGTYIVCSEPLEPGLARALVPSGAAVCDTNFVLDYFRPTPDHRLLYGGRVSYSTRTPRGLVAGMQRRMQGTFPQLAGTRVTHAWGGFVDITMNRAPDFGRLRTDGAPAAPSAGASAGGSVYYLQGFSGHGLALTGLAGKLVAEAMAGDAGRFDVFARLRHRAFPGGPWLRTPALVLGMLWYRLRDLL
jgi:gamma-glutamylputrescine oxidase